MLSNPTLRRYLESTIREESDYLTFRDKRTSSAVIAIKEIFDIRKRNRIRRVPIIGGGAVANNLKTGLTAYWKLDEANGTRNDSHINGLNLTQPINPVASVAGLLNNAASFSGSGNDILVNASASLATGGGSFSVSTWIKILTIAQGEILGKRNLNPPFEGWSLALKAGPFLAIESGDLDFNSDSCVSSVPVIVNTWYHLAASFDVATGIANIWVNNVMDLDAHTSASDSTDTFRIGKFLNMIADETAVWIGRAITQADVTVLYNGGIPFPFGSFL